MLWKTSPDKVIRDAINLYKSNGIAGDPIQVIGNRIRGGGPSTSGGGIMTGDQGGSYILVSIILVNPGSTALHHCQWQSYFNEE